ncbi:hypothetical protein ACOI1C_06015 [Bacillus sp. DJP31]|uniref:hypothetical protein n=1 Tax=Bacillus sp. DJP31 TaxID=3409789 RepID=UPI003BB6E20E
MKKLIVAGILSSSLFLAACAAEEAEPAKETETATETETETEVTETETVDTKAALVTFHISVLDNFKDEYHTYKAYNAAVAAHADALAAQEDAEVPAEDKPTAEAVAELAAASETAKTAAVGLADASAEEIRNFAVPAELEASSADVKSALDDLAKFYEGIKADVANAEANGALFQSFNDKMGVLFDAEGLPAPNYSKAF